MTSLLDTLMAEKEVLLADGATGTNLFAMGLQTGEAPELWNTLAPQAVIGLYRNAVEAGSELFLTNSFGGTAARLKLHGAHKRVREINRVAAELGREIADTAASKVVVAGSVGPTGEIMEPLGPLCRSLATEMFHEQADALKEGGADVLWLETISAVEEFRCAAEAFAMADLPWCGTMSFDSFGRTMMGVTSADLARLVREVPVAPSAFGANCGVGASDLIRTVLGLVGTGTELPIVAKANAGIPQYIDGHIHYDGTPELMADYAAMARDSGARIIGGCCGTTIEHLRAMRTALDERPREDSPTLDRVAAVLGPFSSVSDGTGETVSPKRRRRGNALARRSKPIIPVP